MTEPQMSMREVRAEADRLVFEAGGWLVVGSLMQMTPEALRRRCLSGSVKDARGWLMNLRHALAYAAAHDGDA